MSTTIYMYCAQYHRFDDKYNDADLKTKYKDFSIKGVQKALKQLKIANNNVQEIKFVSRQIRYRLSKKDQNNGIGHPDFQEIDCDKSIKRNFWGFVTQVFQKQTAFFQHSVRCNVLITSKNLSLQYLLAKLFIFLHGFQAFQLHKLHSIWMPLHINKSLT